MAARHSFSELRAKMSPEARSRVGQKTRALQRLIDREIGEPVEKEAVRKRLRAKVRGDDSECGKESR